MTGGRFAATLAGENLRAAVYSSGYGLSMERMRIDSLKSTEVTLVPNGIYALHLRDDITIRQTRGFDDRY